MILDTNMYGRFLNQQDTDMEPVRDWMNKHGKIAYSPTITMEKELRKSPKMKARLLEYSRASKLKLIDKDKVDATARELDLDGLRSNDSHIVALAMCGNVKVLVSADKALRQDFIDIAHGKIYQHKEQKHLLVKDTCP